MDPRLEILYKRRSIRAYDDQPLTKGQIEELLRAAMAAPSAKNGQPWEFVVLTERDVLIEISKRHPHAAFAAECSAAIVVFGDPSHIHLEQDLAAATENLLIAAAGMGLGTCWCGMREERQPPIKELCGLPEEKFIVSLVTVGYPKEEKPPRTNYDGSKVHWGKYGS